MWSNYLLLISLTICLSLLPGCSHYHITNSLSFSVQVSIQYNMADDIEPITKEIKKNRKRLNIPKTDPQKSKAEEFILAPGMSLYVTQLVSISHRHKRIPTIFT
jgi:hypothetical protein